MSDSVLIANYIQYLEHRRDQLSVEWKERRLQYADAKQKYESGKLSRLFGWKFEQSMTWFSPESPGDYFQSFPSAISEIDNEVARLEYQQRLGRDLIGFNAREFNIRKFYQFCKEKGLP